MLQQEWHLCHIRSLKKLQFLKQETGFYFKLTQGTKKKNSKIEKVEEEGKEEEKQRKYKTEEA